MYCMFLKYQQTTKTFSFFDFFPARKCSCGLFYRLNSRFPFFSHKPNLVKSLLFHKPEVWKRFPFRAERPHINHYRGYPWGTYTDHVLHPHKWILILRQTALKENLEHLSRQKPWISLRYCRCWGWSSQLCLPICTVAWPGLLAWRGWWTHHEAIGQFPTKNWLVPLGEDW